MGTRLFVEKTDKESAKDCNGKPTVPNFSGRGLAMESLLERPKEKAHHLASIRAEVLKNLTIFTPNES